VIFIVDDDIQTRFLDKGVGCLYATNSKDALNTLQKLVETDTISHHEPLDEMWLDHDLGLADDIMVVVDWLAEIAFDDNPYPVSKIYIHSMNPAGSKTAFLGLNRYYHVLRVPLP